MPAQPAATPRDPPDPPRAWMPGVGDIVAFGAVLNIGYTAVVVWALAKPESLVGSGVDAWFRFGHTLLSRAYVLAERPSCGGARTSDEVARAWEAYLNLLLVNLAIASALFAISCRLAGRWAQRLRAETQWRDLAPDLVWSRADVGYGTLIWGAIAVLWWLIFRNDLFDAARHCSTIQTWLFLRVPLLTTTAHGFATMAAVFWAMRRGGQGPGCEDQP
jgi:hypothetical protein